MYKRQILNRMVEQFGELPDKTVMEKDMLFATLETSVRSVDTGHNKPFFLTDKMCIRDRFPQGAGMHTVFPFRLPEVQYSTVM